MYIKCRLLNDTVHVNHCLGLNLPSNLPRGVLEQLNNIRTNLAICRLHNRGTWKTDESTPATAPKRVL